MRKLSLHQDASESSSSEFVEIRKTRIVRPEDKAVNEEQIKGIRGRRRALYPVRVAPANGRPVSQPAASNQQPVGLVTPPKNTAVSRTASSPRGRSASPASPSPVRPNRTSALRQNTSSQKTQKSPSVPALESQQVRLRTNSKSPRVSSAPCSPRTLPQPEQETQMKRRSLEVTKLSNGSLASVKTTPANVPANDPLHPPLASIGKQGTFTKEK